MKISFNLAYLITAIIFLSAGFFTLTGDVQKILNFAGPLNEMAFCIFSLLLGVFSIPAAIELKK
jgi:membrane-associated protease RseP (regulator of RpoE activity)